MYDWGDSIKKGVVENLVELVNSALDKLYTNGKKK